MSKTQLEEMGEETDGLASSTSKLRKEIQQLTGVDIMLDENTYKSTYQIILEISKVWDKLDDVSQANVLEKLAGKTRASVVAGLMQQGETLEQIYNDSTMAQGSALKENEEYLKSIQGHLDKLQNTWQSLWSSSVGRDFINFFIDLADKVLKAVESFGLFKSAFLAVFGILKVKSSLKKEKSGGGRAKTISLLSNKYASEELTVRFTRLCYIFCHDYYIKFVTFLMHKSRTLIVKSLKLEHTALLLIM